jgi:hypothetical protein
MGVRIAATAAVVAHYVCVLGTAVIGDELRVVENDEQILVETEALQAAISKKGYVSGVAGGSFVDRKSGFRDAGFGLDIVDWIMEDGSDESYRGELDKELVYEFGNLWHGKTAKRSIEGPQICTRALALSPVVTRGSDFVAVSMSFTYQTAAPGRKSGSEWRQTLVFPAGRRYFFSSDAVTTVNSSESMFLRIDMPGHIRHSEGDTFSEVYLSYHGRIASEQFLKDFAPDEKFNYRRGRDQRPQRMIRAYRLRDPATGSLGPWLAGMTLAPEVVSEAWCHQRGYVCLIEEFGGRPIKSGETFSAAFIVGYFDSVQEMHDVYDQHAGHTGIQLAKESWKLTK